LFEDCKTIYESLTQEDFSFQNRELSKKYNKIVFVGRSIGSGLAAKTASKFQPDLLILETPYYALWDVAEKHYPLIPKQVLKYPIETYKYLNSYTSPVIVFHGDKDVVVPYQSALKLQKHFKDSDRLITLTGYGHNDFTSSPIYTAERENILKRHTP
jgi:hypothetical protein